MRNVKIYPADLTHCGTVTNADPFPSGISCIASYAKQKFGDELFKLPHLDAALKSEAPDILCFSNCVLSDYLSAAFARHATGLDCCGYLWG
jgi:hypothetical protein